MVMAGTQCWMAENLNIGTRANAKENQGNSKIIEKYCYDDDEANCDTYGGLYDWGDVMQSSTLRAHREYAPRGGIYLQKKNGVYLRTM